MTFTFQRSHHQALPVGMTRMMMVIKLMMTRTMMKMMMMTMMNQKIVMTRSCWIQQQQK
jgi:hypothetical protein